MYWLFELIYKHGDIERHPGPSVQTKPGQTKREDRQRGETATRTGKGEKSTMKKWQEKWKRMMSKPARYIAECWGRKLQENEREERIGMENTSGIQNTVTNTKRDARRQGEKEKSRHTSNEQEISTNEKKEIRQREKADRKEKEVKRPKWTDMEKEHAQIQKRLKKEELRWDQTKQERKREYITQAEKARRGRLIHKRRVQAQQITNRQEKERQKRDEKAMQKARADMHANQTKELTETLLTIQTFRKMMKRRDYVLEQREKKGQVEESKDTETQGKQEETESGGELMDQEGENNQGNLQGEEHKNKKKSDKGRRSSLILDKVKRKAKWIKELIYGHGDVHRHPGPSVTRNGQEEGAQTENMDTEQKICEICGKITGKRTCERCREIRHGKKKKK